VRSAIRAYSFASASHGPRICIEALLHVFERKAEVSKIGYMRLRDAVALSAWLPTYVPRLAREDLIHGRGRTLRKVSTT
jgi:hypothetical protein